MVKWSYPKLLVMDGQLLTGIWLNIWFSSLKILSNMIPIWLWVGPYDHELGHQSWFKCVWCSQFSRNCELARAIFFDLVSVHIVFSTRLHNTFSSVKTIPDVSSFQVHTSLIFPCLISQVYDIFRAKILPSNFSE